MALTVGGLGIWYLYDLILVGAGGFRDIDGRRVVSWELEEPHPQHLPDDLARDLLEGIDSLRREVAELSERVDFTERLLANPKDPDRAPGPKA